MNDPFVSFNEIKIELGEIENLGANLSRNLSILSQKIQYIISQIKACETIKDAYEYFKLLDEIQLILAKLSFEYSIGIPDRLSQFVSDFDNLEYERESLFKCIKENKYTF